MAGSIRFFSLGWKHCRGNGKEKGFGGDCEDARREMLLAALIHDVGKITLPEELCTIPFPIQRSLDAICDAMKDCSDVSLYVARIPKEMSGSMERFPRSL